MEKMNIMNKIMEYAPTAHNRSVYASPLLGNDGQRQRRDVARYVSTIFMKVDGVWRLLESYAQ
jgi:hypothetical protein